MAPSSVYFQPSHRFMEGEVRDSDISLTNEQPGRPKKTLRRSKTSAAISESAAREPERIGAWHVRSRIFGVDSRNAVESVETGHQQIVLRQRAGVSMTQKASRSASGVERLSVQCLGSSASVSISCPRTIEFSVPWNARHDVTVFKYRSHDLGPRIQSRGQTSQASLKQFGIDAVGQADPFGVAKGCSRYCSDTSVHQQDANDIICVEFAAAGFGTTLPSAVI